MTLFVEGAILFFFPDASPMTQSAESLLIYEGISDGGTRLLQGRASFVRTTRVSMHPRDFNVDECYASVCVDETTYLTRGRTPHARAQAAGTSIDYIAVY